jgi:HD-like signal output (HDOD) protein
VDDVNILKPGKQKHPAIIIVDDEEAILMSLRSLFRKDSYSMFFFSSPIEALEFLEKNNVDLIITDMRMPEMSGAEFLERSTVMSPGSIRLILSGHEEKSVISKVVSSGLARHFIMKPWDDQQLKKFVAESMEFQNSMRQKKLEEVLVSFRFLPAPPVMHQKLKKMLLKEQILQKNIAAEIEKNPELVANLLRMANSIYYAARKSISSIIEALSFIGTDSVLNMILSLEIFDCLCSSAARQSFQRVVEIRERSVERARIAKEIAPKIDPGVDLQDAFISALMLDIGLIFRCSSAPQKFDILHNEYTNKGKALYVADKQVFSITHDEVGEALLTYWNFSPSIIHAVANHHSYINNGDSLAIIAQVADNLVQGVDSLPQDPAIEEYAQKFRPEPEPALPEPEDILPETAKEEENESI